MFTGIIEELGTVEAIDFHPAGGKLAVGCSLVLGDLKRGDSVAVNGVCLTATDVRPDGFSADLAPETLERTTLEDLRSGSVVNLERPLTMSTRLSGHIVQGHVDGTGAIEALTPLGDGNHELTLRIPSELARFLVYKGSITLDGISLTIASIEETLLKVAIIPHTWQITNLSTLHPGLHVNIECDVLAKHVDKLLGRMAL